MLRTRVRCLNDAVVVHVLELELMMTLKFPPDVFTVRSCGRYVTRTAPSGPSEQSKLSCGLTVCGMR